MRRRTVLSLASAPFVCYALPQSPDDPQHRLPVPEDPDKDIKLPNGKSMKDAIARQNHQKALDDAEELVRLAGALQDELKKAGDYVVPVASVRRTEDIEKLARRIRGRIR